MAFRRRRYRWPDARIRPKVALLMDGSALWERRFPSRVDVMYCYYSCCCRGAGSYGDEQILLVCPQTPGRLQPFVPGSRGGWQQVVPLGVGPPPVE